MDATEILAKSIDKTLLPPLHQKRLLAFVNHFLINSCGFLNDFALQCESKFIELERKLQKVEAALTILEAKLASIPDVEQKLLKEQPIQNSSVIINNETQAEVAVATAEPKIEECAIKGIKAAEHDLYKKFFKMLNVGVPAQAIKIKMQVEGIDSSILDNPNAIIPINEEELDQCVES